jgi:hypothetical protein
VRSRWERSSKVWKEEGVRCKAKREGIGLTGFEVDTPEGFEGSARLLGMVGI